MGNRELRSLLVLGATSVLRRMQGNDKAPKWLSAILTRRPYKVVTVALANKIARIIWVLLTRGGHIGASRQEGAQLALETNAAPINWPLRWWAEARCTKQTMTPWDEIPMQGWLYETMRSKLA